MATGEITPKELERQAGNSFVGKAWRAYLALLSGGLTSASTTAAWDALKLTTGGASELSGTIGAGSFDAGTGKFNLPSLMLEWTGTGGGFTYDRLILIVDNATYPHSIISEPSPVVVMAGDPVSYELELAHKGS
jgi:hypothetical protein